MIKKVSLKTELIAAGDNKNNRKTFTT